MPVCEDPYEYLIHARNLKILETGGLAMYKILQRLTDSSLHFDIHNKISVFAPDKHKTSAMHQHGAYPLRADR